VRVRTQTRARALAAYALVLAVVLGVLGLLVMTSESRHPAPLTPPAGPETVEGAAPEASELNPVERAIGEMRTR
jgi:hypothetical protein